MKKPSTVNRLPSTVNSPFKFLDAYQKEDIDIFFGREQETENLYHALSGVKHLLVYGPSGAGKTSLVECGLRNQFSDADWFALTIRKGENITASVFNSINEALEVKIEIDSDTGLPKDETISFEQAVQYLFEECYQPVYLLFDQFEELLISGTKAEQIDFFKRLNQLIRNRVPCRILLIMREEFIGHLSEFEQYCPTLFQHRFRLEKIRLDNVRDVIIHTLLAPQFINDFKVEEADILADTILSKLPDNRKEIELTHVQVFLSELWDRAYGKNPQSPLLHKNLVHKSDNLERILDSFLQKQLQLMETTHGEKIPLEVLACMITERHTKLQLVQQHIQSDLDKKTVTLNTNLSDIITDFIQRKILRQIKINNITHFEISHDILALVIGKSLTEEMQLREKARSIYAIYEERQELFSQDDLDYLRPFEQYLAFSNSLKDKVETSEKSIETKATQKELANKKRIRTLAVFLSIALIGLVAAIYFGIDANTQKQVAIVEKENAEYSDRAAKVQRDSATMAKQRALTSEQKTKEALVEAEIQRESANIAKEKAVVAEKLSREALIEAQQNLNIATPDYFKKAVLAQHSDKHPLFEKNKNGDYNFERILYDKIDTLDFRKLRISILPEVITLCTNLQSLDLSSNDKISDYSFLEELTNLQSLNLSDNIISNISFLKELTNLQSLNLSDNIISDISSLEKLINLQSLNLHNNKISDCSFLKNLTNLQSLNLYNNQILDIFFLKKLTNLQSLDLSFNIISDYSFLKRLTNLQSLDLSSNDKISDYSFLEKLISLQSLNLSRNRISDYSFLEELTNLQSLNLSENNISDISFLEELTNLQSLDLNYNNISDCSFLEALTKLQSLLLNGNNISEINFLEALTKLQSLDLSSNKISNISFLEVLTKLQFLSLRYNNISDISFLEELTKLQTLDLRENNISKNNKKQLREQLPDCGIIFW